MKNIDKVVFKIGGLAHSDDRRALYELYNNLSLPCGRVFSAKQLKYLEMSDKEDIILGGHYHNYWEFFIMLNGEAQFTLKDIQSQDQKTFLLNKTRGGILIPPKVAHRVSIKAKSLLLGATEEIYLSPKENDIPYDF